jgi:hypothetical protein
VTRWCRSSRTAVRPSTVRSSEASNAYFGGTPFHYPTPVENVSSPAIRAAYDLSFRWPVGRRLFERTSHCSLRIGARVGRWRCRSGEVAIEKATGPLGDVVGHRIFGEQARQLAEELAGVSIIVQLPAYRT